MTVRLPWGVSDIKLLMGASPHLPLGRGGPPVSFVMGVRRYASSICTSAAIDVVLVTGEARL